MAVRGIGAAALERLRQSGQAWPSRILSPDLNFSMRWRHPARPAARTGWQPAHLVLEEAGSVAGILPAYLKSHSQGEYVFDHAWADALERAGGDYYPKLQCSVPFTPVTGPADPDRAMPRNRALLAQGRQGRDGPDRRVVAAHHISGKGGMGGGRPRRLSVAQ